jgi:uncharacterized protein (DUF4415 family)
VRAVSTTAGAGLNYAAPVSRPKVHQEPRVTTAVRLSRAVHERLRRAADERQVSVNLLVEKAVDDYLARLVPVDELQLTRPVKR